MTFRKAVKHEANIQLTKSARFFLSMHWVSYAYCILNSILFFAW